MGLILTEDFEDLVGWTTFGTPTIGPARTGNGVILDSTNDSVSWLLPAHPITLTTGFAMRFSAMPPDARMIMQATGSSDIQFSVLVFADGHIDYRRGSTTVLQASAPGVFTAGGFHFIELTSFLSPKGGVIRIRVDGVDVINAVGQPTQGATSVPYFDRMSYRLSGSNGIVVSTIDDLYLRDDQTMTGDAVVLPPGPPAQVTGFDASIDSVGDAVLTWSPISMFPAVTGYQVERAPDAAGVAGTWAPLATVGLVTSYTDDLAGPGTWWYRVAAINEIGTGLPSAPDSATSSFPPRVTGLTAVHVVATLNDVRLNWTAAVASPAITGYVIERARDINGEPFGWTQIIALGTVTTHLDKAPYFGAWWYRVSAVNSVGTGEPSAAARAFVPYLGCPVGEDYPGWRIFVEAFYSRGRTYGMLTYGAEVYGDLGNVGPTWWDITEPTMSVSIIHGGADADPVVPVNEYTMEFHDDTGEWWDHAAPARNILPTIGTPVRLRLISPSMTFHYLGVGHVETILDEHDRLPRYVSVTAYGNLARLVTSKAGWQRPQENAVARLTALINATGWTGGYTFPTGTDPTMMADPAPVTINVRDEIDRVAMSAGWFMYEGDDGVLHGDHWPHRANTDPVLQVVDCAELPGEMVAHVITFVADTAALLNVAVIGNATQPPHAYESVDASSVSKYGRRSEALGFPKTGLAYFWPDQGVAVADAAKARYKDIVYRVEAFEVSGAVDSAWLGVLADLRIGRPVRITRRGITPFVVDAIVVGFELRLEPNNITATVNVTTVTPTTREGELK